MPSIKTKTIVLTYPWPDRDSDRTDLYRVESLTNSTEYNPHQMLKKAEVESLCRLKDWTVTIKPFRS